MKKLLAVGVIVLFLGLAFQPTFAINLSKSISDDECECDICPKVSKQYFVRLKSLINIIDRYNNPLSVLSKLNPEVDEKYQELSESISTLQDLNGNDDFCDALNNIAWLCLMILETIVITPLLIFIKVLLGFVVFSCLILWQMYCYEDH